LHLRSFLPKTWPTVVGVLACAVVMLAALPAPAQQTATDLPMWYDVSSTTPPNIKLNTDNTFELQNEEQVAVDPTNPNNLVAVWRDFRLGFRQCGWAYSHDGGTNWTEGGLIPATPYNRDSDPGIVAGNNGVFYSVILSFDQFSTANGMHVPVSFDSGLTWPISLSAVDHPPEVPTNLFEDKELMAIDLTGGPTDGNLYIPWTRFGDSTGIFCVTSTNGSSFGAPREVSDRGSVQWPVPTVGADGRVVVAWVSFAEGEIKYDISHDAGWTWGVDRTLQNTNFQNGNLNGGILAFGYPALAADVTPGPYHGRFYCTYVARAADGELDLYLTISNDSALTWSAPVRLTDTPLGDNNDQFHPWTFVNPDGVVTVAFYDRRLDPANLLFDMWITHSFDGGATWTPNQRVSDVSSSPFDAISTTQRSDPRGPQPFDPDVPIGLLSPDAGLIGEYIGLATSRLRATIVFTDTRNGHQDVYTANTPMRLFPPRPLSPADGAQMIATDLDFTWDDYSIYDSALTYILEYSTDPTFATGVVRQEALTLQSANSGPLGSGVYNWRLRAVDPLGDSSALSVVRTVELISQCACDCHADPADCEGVVNVLDVVSTVNVAFRGAAAIPDPNPQCPRETTDVDCSGATDVLDVVRIVNVSFRSADPAAEFCDPCL
jgi:hypothetical protein